MRCLGLKDIVKRVMSDGESHTLDEIQIACEENGLCFENGKGPIYNVMYRLKKKGDVESDGEGAYRWIVQTEVCEGNEENNIEKSKDEKNKFYELEKGIRIVRRKLQDFRKFNWVTCLESELQNARKTANELVELAKEIEKMLLG